MDKLKARRNGHRSRAKVLCKQLNTLILATDPVTTEIEKNIVEIERQKNLILELDVQILAEIADTDVETEISESSDKLMEIEDQVRKGQNLLKTLNKSTENRRETTNNDQPQVKLPQLHLISFAGDPLDWLNIWELFKSSVHERSNLKASQKFQYLRGQLKGEAANLIEGFNNSEAEYNEAIELLCKTYGKKDKLVQARLSALFDLKSPEPTVKSLSDFRSTYEGHQGT